MNHALKSAARRPRRMRALLFALLLAPAAALADDEVWTFAGVDGEFSPRIDWSLGQHLRFADGQVSSWMPEAKLSVDLWRHIDFGLGARYMRERDNDGEWQDRNLYFADLSINHRFGERLRARYRLRWQEEQRDPQDDGAEIRHVLRHKFALEYRINDRFTPYAEVELFDRLDVSSLHRFDRIRYTLGSEIDVGKRKTLSMFLREIDPSEAGEPRTTVLGVEFKISLH